MKFFCDAYLDKPHLLGIDPAKYKCMNKATFETETGILFCSHCYDLFVEGSSRITVKYPWGKEYQSKVRATKHPELKNASRTAD